MENDIKVEKEDDSLTEEEINFNFFIEDENYVLEKDPLDFEQDVKNIIPIKEEKMSFDKNDLLDGCHGLNFVPDVKQEELIIEDKMLHGEEYKFINSSIEVSRSTVYAGNKLVEANDESTSNYTIQNKSVQLNPEAIQKKQICCGSAHENCIKRILICKLCKVQLNSELEFPKHMKTHFSSDLCKEVSLNYNHVKKRILALCLEDKYECIKCGKNLLKNNNMKNYLSLHKHDEVESYVQVNDSEEEVERGEPVNNRKNQIQKSQSLLPGNETKQNCCYKCGKLFTRARNLKQHLFLHTNIRTHQCPECNKSFARAYDLRRHIKSHSTIKNCKHSNSRKQKTPYGVA